VTTLGGGFFAPYGVAVDGSGNVYFADAFNNAVDEMPPGCASSNCVKTLGGGFLFPSGVAVDGSGNVYVADYGNEAVKEIPGGCASSSCVTVLGGGFDGPTAVAVDGSGNVYVADQAGNLVKEMPTGCASSSCVTVLGGGFDAPTGAAVDASGNVYVADAGNNAVKEMMTRGVNFFTVPVGTTSAALTLTFTIYDSGTIGVPAVLTQGGIGKDFKDAGTGTCTTNGTGYTYTENATCTIDVTFSPRFAGTRSGAAELLDGSGNVLASVPIYGVGTGPQVIFGDITQGNYAPSSLTTVGSGFLLPLGVAVDASGNVFVADIPKQSVYEVPVAGGYSQVIALGSGFANPSGVAVDGAGNVFVVDCTSNGAVYEILAKGGYSTVIPIASGFLYPEGLAVDRAGNVFVADTFNGAVKEIAAARGYSTIRTLLSGLNYPYSVAVDGSGNVFVADTENNAVKEILAQGGYTTVNTLGGGFNYPTGVAVDAAGNVYVTDDMNDAIKEIVAAGGYTKVNTLETGFYAFLGGIALDGSGNIFVAHAHKHAIYKLDYADEPTLTFATAAVGSTSSDSPQTVTVQNIGNAALTFPIPASGNDPGITANFTLNSSQSDACPLVSAGSSQPGTLAAGASCLLPISFAPTTGGNITGSLTLTDNNLNAVSPAYATQSLELSGTGATTPPFGHIDSAVDNVTLSTTVGQSDSVVIRGWVADKIDGAPLSNVRVYIDGKLAGTPFLGLARPDVAAAKGAAYLDSGYQLTYSVAALALGSHAVTVIAIDSGGLSTTFGPLAITVAATAGPAAPTPPLGHLDTAVDSVTASSTVGQSDSVVVKGWAADLIDGAPLSNVKVYVDGNLAGTPTLGVARPDVAAAYSNAAYLDSGYTLTFSVAALSLGSHAVTVIAIDSGGRSTTFGPLDFTIAATAGPAPPAPPFGSLDSARDSLTGSTTVGQSDSVVVRGWAADQVDGAPLSNVNVYIDGILAGTPTLGIARPDVATAKGAAYLDSGFQLSYSAAGLALGSHAVTVVAIDSGNRSTTFGPLDITVQ
jgi:sugar lactone lactonase YvrE